MMLEHYPSQEGMRQPGTPLDYDFIGHAVHHLILTTRSLDAVQAWRQKLNYVYFEASFRTILTLTDARRTVVPPLALATHISDLWMAHGHHPLYSHNAILHPDAATTGMAGDLLGQLPGSEHQTLRFFPPEMRTEDVRWLIAQD